MTTRVMRQLRPDSKDPNAQRSFLSVRATLRCIDKLIVQTCIYIGDVLGIRL